MIEYHPRFIFFVEYVELAVKEGIITVGGDKGHAWMSLNEGSRDKVF